KIAIVDESGVLTMHSVDTEDRGAMSDEQKRVSELHRKDVWDIKFAQDDPNMFAIMEKTRMFIFDGFQPEPAIQTSAFICAINDLEVFGVLLDEIVSLGNQPSKECLLKIPVKVTS
ncbi:unnamed protein product, partial [Dicrocoelium dendriticum]